VDPGLDQVIDWSWGCARYTTTATVHDAVEDVTNVKNLPVGECVCCIVVQVDKELEDFRLLLNDEKLMSALQVGYVCFVESGDFVVRNH
jgi:hypothetical protein